MGRVIHVSLRQDGLRDSQELGGVMLRRLSQSRVLALVLFLTWLAASLVLPTVPSQAATDKLRDQHRVFLRNRCAWMAGFSIDTIGAVSTARRGYRTPVGKYRPTRLERMWYSSKYENSPMPYSIFFLGGYAIHGTYEVKRLGRAVSHGCIRLHPEQCAQAVQPGQILRRERIP